MKEQSNKGTKEHRNNRTKEQRSKGTKDQRNKETKSSSNWVRHNQVSWSSFVFNRRGVTPKLLKLGGEKLTVVSQTALISDNCPWISVRPDNRRYPGVWR